MNPELKAELDEIIKLIHSLIKKKGLPPGLAEYADKSPLLGQLVNDLTAICEFANTLSNGDLSQTLGLRGYFPGALKALQANLRHLTWQTSMVAAGDYSQRVDFMGDFSLSFNTMIIRLQQATENEQRYIAELEKSQAAIAESERKYRLIAENTDDVIWLLDKSMKVCYISPSITKLTGYAPEKFTGKTAVETPMPCLQAIFHEASIAFANEAAAKKPLIIESEQVRHNEKIIWTESLVSIASNNEGDFVGYLGVTRDISERKRNESLVRQAYERRKKAEFFNQLTLAKSGSELEMLHIARQNKIYIPQNFSCLVLTITSLDTLVADEHNLHRKQQIIDALVDFLSRKESTIAWETTSGIAVIVPVPKTTDRKTAELETAREYSKEISLYFPDLQIVIGLANYAAGLSLFASRLHNAATAAAIGTRIWPGQQIYHYDDCGIYQVLAPFARTDDAHNYIKRLIGPLIAHDKAAGTHLVETLEKLLSGLSFKEIGGQMYLHHKTIQLRKQRIEQILELSLDCHETRLTLATALQLHRLTQPTQEPAAVHTQY
ncbi:PAS domain S-box protein [Sporomusa termitida]|uniref:PAS domain S-box protein n=1 Tax=Sporomusa termitida TaxID=2377 RepID=A0A517DY23_9FIRM|nr:PAS domain S-box protein [Sporomusa termitida]QDR82260.1 PAS domain S-box protein [Sporomusa termitida]